jgi:hypothetical protein
MRNGKIDYVERRLNEITLKITPNLSDFGELYSENVKVTSYIQETDALFIKRSGGR